MIYDKQISNNFFKIFFLLFFLFSVIKIIDNSLNLDSYQYGNWLINYQAGFVRRGLLGEIVYHFSSLFNYNFILAVIVFVTVICLIYYVLLYKLFSKIELNFVWLLLIFSPLVFFYIVNQGKAGVHPTIILFAFYVYFLLNLEQVNNNNLFNFSIYAFLIVYLFIWEGAYFYFIYFLIPQILTADNHHRKKLLIKFGLFLTIASFFMILIYVFRGNADSSKIICESLKEFAPAKCDWWGGIATISKHASTLADGTENTRLHNWEYDEVLFGFIPKYFYLHSDIKTILGFLIYIAYSILPLLLFYRFASVSNENNINIFKYCFLAAIVFSTPIFHLGEDWLRWISYHLNFIAFLLVILFKINFLKFNQSSKYLNILEKLKIIKIRRLFYIFLVLYPFLLYIYPWYVEGNRLQFTIIKVIEKQLK